MTDMQAFYDQMQAIAIEKGKKMAALELQAWNQDPEKHESELKQFFGFTDKKLVARKKQLQKDAA